MIRTRIIAALIIASFIALVALAALFLRSQHKGADQFAQVERVVSHSQPTTHSQVHNHG